eukprot:416935-Pleurochrysis_carterae.AAC.1
MKSNVSREEIRQQEETGSDEARNQNAGLALTRCHKPVRCLIIIHRDWRVSLCTHFTLYARTWYASCHQRGCAAERERVVSASVPRAVPYGHGLFVGCARLVL